MSEEQQSKRARWAGFAAGLWLMSLAATAGAADIAPYEDQRDSNYLKVMYHFAYPVGKVAEMFFFRPLHAFSAVAGQPDPDRRFEAADDVSACITFRPMRKCSRR